MFSTLSICLFVINMTQKQRHTFPWFQDMVWVREEPLKLWCRSISGVDPGFPSLSVTLQDKRFFNIFTVFPENNSWILMKEIHSIHEYVKFGAAWMKLQRVRSGFVSICFLPTPNNDTTNYPANYSIDTSVQHQGRKLIWSWVTHRRRTQHQCGTALNTCYWIQYCAV